MPLRDLPLVEASLPASASLAEAAAALSATRSPALAAPGEDGRTVGIFAEGDLLRAVVPAT
jgi:CBS domain-containing protein